MGRLVRWPQDFCARDMPAGYRHPEACAFFASDSVEQRLRLLIVRGIFERRQGLIGGNVLRFLVFLCCLLSGVSLALADTHRRTVPANKTSVVNATATFSKGDCSGGALPRFKVSKAPKHGSVSFRKVTFTLTKRAGRCAGKRVKGMEVLYKPANGYRGKDDFKVGFTMNRYVSAGGVRHVTDSYKITVK